MNVTPDVTVVCPTFARPALLAELAQSFLQQDYAGKKSLIVLNDCPAQTLTCDTPGVRVINTGLFPRIADKYNALIAQVSTPLMCVWDDDDIFMPEFLRLVIGKMRADDHAMRLSRIMRWDGRIATILPGVQQHTAVYKTASVRRVGGIPDSEFSVPDFTKRCVQYKFYHGRHQNEPDAIRPCVIYRTNHGAHQMEGNGTRRTYHDFQQLALQRLHGRNNQRRFTITPRWSQDWSALVDTHWNPNARR